MTSQQKHILVVEDEKPIFRVLKMKLEQKGYTVSVAENGKEAVEMFETQDIDGVLLDLILPEQDGFETLQKIRERDADVPVAVLSNLGQPEDKERVEEYGIIKYYVKADVSLHELVSEISEVI